MDLKFIKYSYRPRDPDYSISPITPEISQGGLETKTMTVWGEYSNAALLNLL